MKTFEKRKIEAAETLGEHEGLAGSGPNENPFGPTELAEAWERGRKKGAAMRKQGGAKKTGAIGFTSSVVRTHFSERLDRDLRAKPGVAPDVGKH